MPTPNIPADFDFLDPDVNLAGLPVAELAELRNAEPIHWVDVPAGTGGFGDKGYWLVTKHKDVKEVSLRSDVFSSWQNGAIPVWPPEMTREAGRLAAQRDAQHGRAPPHPVAQDHLPRFHSARGRTPTGGAQPTGAAHRQERRGGGHG